ncbi:MAG: flavodoxin family protein [Candidatus Lokiarchaeota archaeon]|nr:flavodoxin family protein [Candidatus Lokiarchaeota archaeon]
MILGINGSPHKDGNTSYALHYALSLLENAGFETEYITLADKKINFCKACLNCRRGNCVHNDDMQFILDSMRRSSCIVLASPVFMGQITGQMKTMMDRTVVLRIKGYEIGERFELSGKIGACIACGGFRNGGQELTLQNMHTFFLQQDMHIISDGPPFSHSGATIVGDTKDDTLGLQTINNLTKNIIKILNKSNLR